LRRYAVRYRREGDTVELESLEQSIPALSKVQAHTVARAFAYFLHLSNIAEDREQNRMRDATDISTQIGSLERAFAILTPQHNRKKLREFLSSASVVPVLTAHPTEVQRQSTLAIHREIANLLPELDRSSAGLKQKRQQQRLVALITTMWKTRLLRQHTLTVLDEIDNALAYYPHTF